jgi:hypothetical protein
MTAHRVHEVASLQIPRLETVKQAVAAAADRITESLSDLWRTHTTHQRTRPEHKPTRVDVGQVTN